MNQYNRLLAQLLVLAVLIGGIAYGAYILLLRPVIVIDGTVKTAVIYDMHGNTVRKFSGAGSTRIGSGAYDIEITSDSGTVSKVIALGLRQKQTVAAPENMPPNSTKVIATVPAIEPAIQSSAFGYVDPTQKTFSTLSGDGVSQILSQPTTGSDQAGSQAITQISSIANNKRLLVTSGDYVEAWDGSNIKQLDATGIDLTNLNQNQVLVGSNSSQGDFLVAVDKTIYYYASTDSTPKKIATLQTDFNRLIFGGTRFLAFDSTLPYSRPDLSSYYAKQFLVYPVLADIRGHSIQLTQPVVDAFLAPDGQHALIQYRQSSNAKIYSLGADLSLQSQAIINRPTSTAAWDAANSFVYSANGTLWRYNLQTNWATALATGVSLPPSSISPQTDGSILYTELVNDKTITYQAQNAVASQQNSALEKFVTQNITSSGLYGLSYVDLGKPTFVLALTPNQVSTGSDLQSFIDQYGQQATQDLTQRLTNASVDPSAVTIKTAF